MKDEYDLIYTSIMQRLIAHEMYYAEKAKAIIMNETFYNYVNNICNTLTTINGNIDSFAEFSIIKTKTLEKELFQII